MQTLLIILLYRNVASSSHTCRDANIFHLFVVWMCRSTVARQQFWNVVATWRICWKHSWSNLSLASHEILYSKTTKVLGERYYVTFALWHEPSVCPSVCLSVRRQLWRCTLLRDELFGNIFAPSNSLKTRTVCVKMLEKFQRGSTWSCKINERGMKNWRFSTNVSLYFENGTRYGYSYSGRRIGTCMQSTDWYHFQWPWVTHNLDLNVK